MGKEESNETPEATSEHESGGPAEDHEEGGFSEGENDESAAFRKRAKLDEETHGLSFIVELKWRGDIATKENLLRHPPHENISEMKTSLRIKQPFSAMNRAKLYLWCFGINASTDCTTSCATITSVDFQTPAERDGRLKANDRILEINDIPLPLFLEDERPLLSFGDTLKLKVQRSSQFLTDPESQRQEVQEGGNVIFDVRGEEITFPRSQVAAHSPVLAAMLSHDTLEKQSNRIKVDFDPKVFRTVLGSLESGLLNPVEKGYHHLLEVAQAADYYEIKALKKPLSERLHLYTSKEIAVEMALRACELGLAKDELMKPLMSFIALWWDEIMVTQSDLLVAHPELLLDICRFMHQREEKSWESICETEMQLRVCRCIYSFEDDDSFKRSVGGNSVSSEWWEPDEDEGERGPVSPSFDNDSDDF